MRNTLRHLGLMLELDKCCFTWVFLVKVNAIKSICFNKWYYIIYKHYTVIAITNHSPENIIY
jgi:hypothetical protein